MVQTQPTEVRYRLDKQTYQQLEVMFPPTRTSDPTLAAIQLGEQRVLQALRDLTAAS